MAAAPFSSVAGPPDRSSPMVRSRWRAIKLLLNLLVRRTISPRLKESKLNTVCASAGVGLHAQFTVELSAQLPPQLDEGAEGVRCRLQQHAGEAALRALRRQGAAEHHLVPSLRCHLEIDARGRGAAAPD